MMVVNRIALSAALFLSLLAAGCGGKSLLKPVGPIEERKLAPEIAGDARALVAANNRFALDVYDRLRARSGNLFLSPYSISTAFGMVYAGAAGQTDQEIAGVFHFPLPQERLHSVFGALQRSLDRGTQSGRYELRVANRIWGQKGFPFLPRYLEVTRQDYGAALAEADFERDAEAARLAANAWVEQQTNHRIVDLFPSGAINDGTRLVLANAIYFKGLWVAPFDRAKTSDAPFYLGESENVNVPTMHRQDVYRVAQAAGARMLELPYQGGDLSMLILLPDRLDGLPELEASLAPDRLNAWIGALAPSKEPLLVMLPSFKFSSKFGLGETLAAMGMPSAFGGAADFSGIDGRRDLFISAAIHQAFVEVNEDGTEAAAATGVVAGITSVMPTFAANHPFLFLIRDNVTESILFIGRVVDPR